MMSPGEIADDERWKKDNERIAKIRAVAFDHGYALMVHGSRSEKDLDLLAVPWTEDATSALNLINEIVKNVPLLHRGERVSEMRSGNCIPNKPHGRYATMLIDMDDRRLIDLSIMPRVTENKP